jgi:integrase
MAIRKRGETWVIDYYDPSGKRIVKGGFKRRKEAKQEEAARLEAMDKGTYYEKATQYTTTFAKLVGVYVENFKHQPSYARSKKYMIETLAAEFSNRLLSKITYKDLETFRNRFQQTLSPTGKIRRVATVNRYMACLRHMMTKAVTWDMVAQNPFQKGESLQLQENNERTRFLTEEEISKLLAECPTVAAKRVGGKFVVGPQALYLKDFIIVAINTGMRKGEILSLKWEQIKGGLIYLTDTKSNKPRQIPINDDLAECFKSIKQKQQLGTKYVICGEDGKGLADIKTAFAGAVRRAQIEDCRPHDLRHTFASHYLMRGGNLGALQKILGHSNIRMTMRYSHFSDEFTHTEIQLLNGLTSNKNKTGSNNLVTFPDSQFATTS